MEHTQHPSPCGFNRMQVPLRCAQSGHAHSYLPWRYRSDCTYHSTCQAGLRQPVRELHTARISPIYVKYTASARLTCHQRQDLASYAKVKLFMHPCTDGLSSGMGNTHPERGLERGTPVLKCTSARSSNCGNTDHGYTTWPYVFAARHLALEGEGSQSITVINYRPFVVRDRPRPAPHSNEGATLWFTAGAE
jgi:hypothetical protein